MGISVNTNLASLTAQKSLGKSTTDMNTAMQRLSTGYKINSSKDDAAGMAVASKLNYKLSSYNVAKSNAQMGESMLDTAESIMSTIQANLQRIRDLTEQAANGTYGSDSMTAIVKEVQSRVEEITRISASVEFNGKYLLNGSIEDDINLQVGIENNENSIIKLSASLFADASSKSLLGIEEIEDIKEKYQNDTTAREFLTNIDDALAEITDRVSQIGGIQQRLVTVLEATETLYTSVTGAVSSIQDVDVAEESTSYIKEQILQQLSTSMLSVANQSPAIALSLLS
ncbi:flagellin FliC [bacterium]|nr:flagellin FliC [bacterium]